MLLYLEGKRSVCEMKKLLMLGTSQGSCEMIRIARAKGIYTIVTDFDLPEKSIGKLIADEYWMINTADMDALEKRCREEQIDGVVCGVSEFNLERTMELTERLGLPCYCTPEAWHFSRNKHDFKKLCKVIGVRMAEDYQLSNPPMDEELSKVKFPVVVKAINLSANRGMIAANIGGFIVCAIWKVLGNPLGIGGTLPGALVCAALLICVSLATYKKYPSKIA